MNLFIKKVVSLSLSVAILGWSGMSMAQKTYGCNNDSDCRRQQICTDSHICAKPECRKQSDCTKSNVVGSKCEKNRCVPFVNPVNSVNLIKHFN